MSLVPTLHHPKTPTMTSLEQMIMKMPSNDLLEIAADTTRFGALLHSHIQYAQVKKVCENHDHLVFSVQDKYVVLYTHILLIILREGRYDLFAYYYTKYLYFISLDKMLGILIKESNPEDNVMAVYCIFLYISKYKPKKLKHISYIIIQGILNFEKIEEYTDLWEKLIQNCDYLTPSDCKKINKLCSKPMILALRQHLPSHIRHMLTKG